MVILVMLTLLVDWLESEAAVEPSDRERLRLSLEVKALSLSLCRSRLHLVLCVQILTNG